MPNVITFTPRPRPVALEPVPPAADLGLRAHLEEAAQTALDAADKIIAALDQIEEDPSAVRIVADTRPVTVAASAEPVTIPHEVAAPSKPIIVAAPETPMPEVSVPVEDIEEIEAVPVGTVHEPLPWYGAGNVVSFVVITLLSMIAGE